MKEFQEANYARVRRRGPRRSSSDIARAKIQGKRHRVSGCQLPFKQDFFPYYLYFLFVFKLFLLERQS